MELLESFLFHNTLSFYASCTQKAKSLPSVGHLCIFHDEYGQLKDEVYYMYIYSLANNVEFYNCFRTRWDFYIYYYNYY